MTSAMLKMEFIAGASAMTILISPLFYILYSKDHIFIEDNFGNMEISGVQPPNTNIIARQ